MRVTILYLPENAVFPSALAAEQKDHGSRAGQNPESAVVSTPSIPIQTPRPTSTWNGIKHSRYLI